MRATLGSVAAAWRCALAAGLLTLAATAQAAPPLPPEVATSLPDAALQGQGTMRYFGLTVYDARLWADARFAAERYPAHAFALELRYARALSGAAIVRRSVAEMRRIDRVDDAQALTWNDALLAAIPDVAAGDRLTGLHVPGEATRFFHNGRPTSTVAGPEFARAFFGIWLAANTSEPGLRRQLIGSPP